MSLADERTPVIANFKDKSEIVSYVYQEKDLKEAIKRLILKGSHNIDEYGDLKQCLIIKKEDIKEEFGEELI